ncbi:hypothetical protein SDC9_97718 [bioreactor metagenome]|uniref:Uncharacterized protein n=1 Tax=bioreactor metagenome TaxID=1076179 RepID=A0A645ACP4_9ZZZZ
MRSLLSPIKKQRSSEWTAKGEPRAWERKPDWVAAAQPAKRQGHLNLLKYGGKQDAACMRPTLGQSSPSTREDGTAINDGRCRSVRFGPLGRSYGERSLRLRLALELLGDVSADQIAQGINGLVRNAVDGAVSAAFACHQTVLGQQRQMPRDVGRAVTAQLGEFAHAALLLAQQVEDLQARWLGQRLEVRRHLFQRLVGKVFHMC